MNSQIISYRLSDEEFSASKAHRLSGESLSQSAQRLLRDKLGLPQAMKGRERKHIGGYEWERWYVVYVEYGGYYEGDYVDSRYKTEEEALAECEKLIKSGARNAWVRYEEYLPDKYYKSMGFL